ncbi:ATP-binding protein [Pseudoalteromonas luteoviolacea]|uniref:IstB-like ATP-binding domain-containing protein n=1 Tax=Pseudoalteromonas luteoviolacea S4060-1 TaxID=1365257 RepID=A0A167PBM2_9GAMM|nr:ATP-binding protein [Pseudoalteromonas luteoviolacea]KZN70327.1 hypothetical protein N478_00055 [Pseudoalteromonas luteoviolacea S4060-1]
MNTRELSARYKNLKLHGAAQVVDKLQLKDPMPSMDVLNILNDIVVSQENYVAANRQVRLKRAAKLRWPDAKVEDYDYGCESEGVQYLIDKACQGEWVDEHLHQVITGSSGTGKTTLACGFANKLLLNGYTVQMWRYNDLIFELSLHQKEGTYPQFLKKLCKFAVLVIDDWALFPLENTQRQMLYELIERREQLGSLIITSQYDFSDWHAAIGEQTIADAVLDRISSMSEHIALKGDPKRISHRSKGATHEI